MRATTSLPTILTCIAVVLGVAAAAAAQDTGSANVTFWRADPSIIGDWFNMANWSAGVPGEETYAYINNGGAAAVGDDSTHAMPAVAGYLHLGGDLGGSLHQNGGWLTVTHDTWLGRIGYGMPLPEIYPGPAGGRPGKFLLNDGAYQTRNLYISSGWPFWLYDATMAKVGSVFRQSGGGSVIGHALHVGYQPYPVIALDPATGEPDAAGMMGAPEPDYLYRPGALYALSGGSLSAPRAYVGYGGKGRIHQEAGDAEIGALFVGGGQSYLYPLPMDPTRPAAESLAGYPWYYDGGAYTLGGGALKADSVHVGQRGRGRFTQTGGTADVAKTLQVGGNWYWYPTLTQTDPATGTDPDAAMTSVVTPEYYLPAHGTYSLVDGELTTADTEIGIGGIGHFSQSGGTHKVAGTVRIGGSAYWPTLDPLMTPPAIDGADGTAPEGGFAPAPYPGPAAGSYTMSDGSLAAARMELGAGYGGWPINWLDGSAPVSSDLWAPIPWRPANFTQTGGEVAIDETVRVLGGGYHLVDGQLNAGRLHLTEGNAYGPSQYTQTGGVAQIAGELLLGAEVTITDPTDPAETPPYGPYYWGSNLCTIGGGRLTAGNIRLDGPGASRLTQTGGHVTTYGGVHILGDDATVNLRGGSLTTGVMQVGRLVNNSSGAVPSSRLCVGGDSIVTVTDRLVFGAGGAYCAEDGTEILMNGADLENYSRCSAALAGLGNTRLTFSIGPEDDLDWETFEVAGKDLGLTRQGFWNNFVLESLVLGGHDVGEVQLVDLFDNQLDWDRPEALYVRELIVGPGSTLDLNGLHLYSLCSKIDPNGSVIGGELDQIDVQDWAIPGDSNMDGKVDLEDFVCLKNNFGLMFRAHWGCGDYDGNGCVDLSDFVILKNNFGRGSALPEPATMTLLMLGSSLLVRRRRR